MTKKYFETARINLKIKGRHLHENQYRGITPAEFLVMQEVHGPHSVQFLGIDGTAELRRIRHNNTWERRPLTMRELHDKLVDKYKGAVKKVFPAANPILPYSFADIGVSTDKPGGELADMPAEDPNESLWEPMKVQPVADKNPPAPSIDDLVGTVPAPKTEKKKAG